jgi:hypothetical protein
MHQKCHADCAKVSSRIGNLMFKVWRRSCSLTKNVTLSPGAREIKPVVISHLIFFAHLPPFAFFDFLPIQKKNLPFYFSPFP